MVNTGLIVTMETSRNTVSDMTPGGRKMSDSIWGGWSRLSLLPLNVVTPWRVHPHLCYRKAGGPANLSFPSLIWRTSDILIYF